MEEQLVKARWMWRVSGAVVGLLGVLVLTGLAAPSQQAEVTSGRERFLREDAKQVEAGIVAEGPDLLEAALGELEPRRRIGHWTVYPCLQEFGALL